MGSGTRTGRSWWRRTRHLVLKGKTLNDMLVINLYLFKDRLIFLTIIFNCWKMFDQVPGALLLISSDGVTSLTGVFRIAHLSFLPTNACSTGNNIPFPLFHLRGKWPITSCEIKCWQAKHDKNVTLELPFSFFFFPWLRLCSVLSILKSDQILLFLLRV